MTTRITLIAHAVTDAQRRAAFPLNEPLAEQEIIRIAAPGWSAPRAQRTISAPERRALQTAKALGLTAEVAQEVRDCDYGAWSGLDLTQVARQNPEDVAAWLSDPAAAPHGGESLLNLIGRIGLWLADQRAVKHTVAVTHPAVIRAAIVNALDAPAQTFWRIDILPLSLTDLRWNGRAWTLRSCGNPLPLAAANEDQE